MKSNKIKWMTQIQKAHLVVVQRIRHQVVKKFKSFILVNDLDTIGFILDVLIWLIKHFAILKLDLCTIFMEHLK